MPRLNDRAAQPSWRFHAVVLGDAVQDGVVFVVVTPRPVLVDRVAVVEHADITSRVLRAAERAPRSRVWFPPQGSATRRAAASDAVAALARLGVVAVDGDVHGIVAENLAIEVDGFELLGRLLPGEAGKVDIVLFRLSTPHLAQPGTFGPDVEREHAAVTTHALWVVVAHLAEEADGRCTGRRGTEPRIDPPEPAGEIGAVVARPQVVRIVGQFLAERVEIADHDDALRRRAVALLGDLADCATCRDLDVLFHLDHARKPVSTGVGLSNVVCAVAAERGRQHDLHRRKMHTRLGHLAVRELVRQFDARFVQAERVPHAKVEHLAAVARGVSSARFHEHPLIALLNHLDLQLLRTRRVIPLALGAFR